MIRQAIIQGTDEWLKWRMLGVGGSEIAAVLGLSEWMTPFELWAIKTCRMPAPAPTYPMLRGRRLEAPARRDYERQTGLKMPPSCVVHPKYSHIRVSLDGRDINVRVTLEAKCPGRKDHSMAKMQRVPEKYKPQVQYQLTATSDDRLDYFSFDGEQPGTIVPVEPDLKYQSMLIEKVGEFWHMVETDTAPDLTPLDHKRMRKSKDPARLKIYRDWGAARAFTKSALFSLGQIYGGAARAC